MSSKQGVALAFKAVATLLVSLWVATSHATTELYYVHTDHLGTPQVMTDKDQDVVWKRSQTPFGETVEETGTLEQPLRFPGQYRDRETGFSYNYHRDYEPGLGRYVQSDPIGLAGGINTYGYVDGNPIKYVDPLGLYRWPQDIYNDALSDAQRSGLPGPHNGPQDAYRHCLASCESARENGEWATQCMAWANEKKGDWKRGQEQGERAMDDHNNAVGISFGSSANSFQQCKNMCMGAVHTGKTINNYQPGSTPDYSPGSAY